MTVGYNKARAWLTIGLWAACVVLGLVTLGRRESNVVNYVLMFVGGFGMVVGVRMLSRPLFALEDNRIVVFGLIGPLIREFKLASKQDLRISGGKLYIGDKKLPIRKQLCDPSDWEKLAAVIKLGQ